MSVSKAGEEASAGKEEPIVEEKNEGKVEKDEREAEKNEHAVEKGKLTVEKDDLSLLATTELSSGETEGKKSEWTQLESVKENDESLASSPPSRFPRFSVTEDKTFSKYSKSPHGREGLRLATKSERFKMDRSKGGKHKAKRISVRKLNKSKSRRNHDMTSVISVATFAADKEDEVVEKAKTEKAAEFNDVEVRMKIFEALRKLDQFVGDRPPEDFDEDKLKELNVITEELRENARDLQNYCDDYGQKLAGIRQPIEKATAAIAAKLTTKLDDTPGQCTLDVKQKKLKQHLAALNDDLIKASLTAAQTELAVLESQKACEDSMALAEVLKAEMEEKKRLASEASRLKEIEMMNELKRLAEEERLQREEELREKELLMMRQEEGYLWPIFPLLIESRADFDAGVGCLVKADPTIFLEGRIYCTVLDTMQVPYRFIEDEELVSHVVSINIHGIKCDDGALTIRPDMCLSIPHCMPRTQSSVRELVVKLRLCDFTHWIELPVSDGVLESYKDMRFAQVQTHYFGTYMVVSRNKKTVVRVKRTGGNVHSKLDPKLIFHVPQDALVKPEKIVVQLQPIDNLVLKYLKKQLILANNLLNASYIIKLTWVNKSFENSIKITIPIPPNPISLKKMNTNKQSKEEEAPKPAGAVASTKVVAESSEPNLAASRKDLADSDSNTGGVDEDVGGLKTKPIQWYMGIYDNETEDESDNLYVVRKKKGKWVVEDMNLVRTSIDSVTITLKEPLETFMVLRTAVSIKFKGAEIISTALDNLMSKKIVCFAVCQNRNVASEFKASVVSIQKMDKYVAAMEEKYHVIAVREQHFMLKEGEKVTVTFRGNLQCTSAPENLSARFNTNFDCNMHLVLNEHDIFVQKCYAVYRGFVQLSKFNDGDADEKSESLTRISKQRVSATFQNLKKPEMLCEYLVTLPKNVDLLTLELMHRMPIQYNDEGCAVSIQMLARLAMELGSEWLDLGRALGLSPVLLHIIENNAMHSNCSDIEKKLDMLLNWNKTELRSSNKIDALLSAIQRVGRADLEELIANDDNSSRLNLDQNDSKILL